MVVEWLGKDFALDILAIYAIHNILDCLFCHIIHRKIRTKAKSTGKSVNLAFECNKSLQSYFILMTLTIHLSILL